MIVILAFRPTQFRAPFNFYVYFSDYRSALLSASRDFFCCKASVEWCTNRWSINHGSYPDFLPFVFHRGFLWQVSSGRRANRDFIVRGCSAPFVYLFQGFFISGICILISNHGNTIQSTSTLSQMCELAKKYATGSLLKCQLLEFRSLVRLEHAEQRSPNGPFLQLLIRCTIVAQIDFFVDSNAFKIKLYTCDRVEMILKRSYRGL